MGLGIGTRRPWSIRLAAHKSLAGLAVIATAGTVAVGVGCGPVSAEGVAPRAAAARYAAPAACKSGTCWVDVSVATAWVKPWYPRPVDKPALGNPAYPGTWARNMTLAQKRSLQGRLETQALYGTKVIVTGHWNNWTHVAIPGQPTNRDSRGYPGWIPSVQLTSTAPATVKTWAIIRVSSAWLWSGWKNGTVAGAKVMMASYDTSLPVVSTAAWHVDVKLIGGRIVAVHRRDVILHTAGTSWAATRAKVVSEARRFLGLAYLWAGTSGHGFDCSGFTYSVYRAYGVTLSRDADQQAVHGAHPDIVRAQARHLRLIRRHGRETVHAAYNMARLAWEILTCRGRGMPHVIVRDMPLAEGFGHQDWAARPRDPVHIAASYPEVVTLTGLLASPRWRTPGMPAVADDGFLAELRRRLPVASIVLADTDFRLLPTVYDTAASHALEPLPETSP